MPHYDERAQSASSASALHVHDSFDNTDLDPIQVQLATVRSRVFLVCIDLLDPDHVLRLGAPNKFLDQVDIFWLLTPINHRTRCL